MGCCNHLTTGLVTGAPNPTMHVNFVKGMVLGVDDFRQEFAYLSNGYQWAIRELIGYGTASGLAVKIEDDGTNGPRIQVTPGAAVPPSGRMICVGAPQCGWLNDWLAKPDVATKLTSLLSADSPPDAGEIDVYLTLCFRDCAVLPVPIPGEPCRSDDELMTPSRIADDYVLSLSFDPPDQSEADAIAKLVAWIDTVEIEGSLSPPLDEEAAWHAALLEALGMGADVQSPPESSPPLSSPPTPSSPPEPLSVAEDRYDEFLRYVFRIWVTDIRPIVMARRCGTDADDRDDCLLLARLRVPVLREGDAPDRGWQVVGNKDDIEVDESRRPMIVPLHLVQTVLGMAVGADGEMLSPPPGPQGDPGANATIAIGSITTLPPGSNAIVSNVGTASAAVFEFGIPQGDPGDPGGPGTDATIAIGAVTALPAGAPPTVTNVGTPSAAILDFGIPKGEASTGDPGTAATIAVGAVTAVPAGSAPTVTNSGTPSAAVFAFGIPKGKDGKDGGAGAPGTDATITIGAVTALPAGSPPTVTNTGTPSAAKLNFGIPQGKDGGAGAPGTNATVSAGTVTILPAGSAPTVTNTGTASAAVFDFGIPETPAPGVAASPLRLLPKFVTKNTKINPKDDIDTIVVEVPNGRVAIILPPIPDPRVETGRVYIIRAKFGTAVVRPFEGDSLEASAPGGQPPPEFAIPEGRAYMFMSRHEKIPGTNQEIREWVFILDLMLRQG